MSDGTNQLVEQGKFLAANVAKYPANQKLIDAIKDAIHLQHDGLLSNKEADSSSSGTEIVIYDNPMKPLRSQQLDNGDCLVYGIRIVCDLTRKLPFSITVNNSYAPIKVTEKGTLSPQMSKAHDKVSVSMKFSEKDWFAVVDQVLALNSNERRRGFFDHFCAFRNGISLYTIRILRFQNEFVCLLSGFWHLSNILLYLIIHRFLTFPVGV